MIPPRTSTITPEQEQAIATTLDRMTLPSGIGDRHNACSIAAINLALTNILSDDIPSCMSEVLGRWIILNKSLVTGSSWPRSLYYATDVVMG